MVCRFVHRESGDSCSQATHADNRRRVPCRFVFFFKYLTFVAPQLPLCLHRDFSVISITLPIGISVFVLGCLLSAPVWLTIQRRFAQGHLSVRRADLSCRRLPSGDDRLHQCELHSVHPF